MSPPAAPLTPPFVMAVRLYQPDLADAGSPLRLDEAEAGHARRSLRLEVGDTVELFDGAGAVATGRIAEAKKTVTVELVDRYQAPRPRPWIDLAAAVPKGDRADTLTEQASALGADRLVPLIAERSVVEPRPNKLRRFRRLAVESAKQCGRGHLMAIEEPTPLENVLRGNRAGLKLLADTEANGPSSLHGVRDLHTALAEVDHVSVLIGPEGGWTDRERHAAFAAGFQAWRFAPHTLRIEAAAAAALAVLRAAG